MSDLKEWQDTTLDERFGICPYATAQSLISGKWAILILYYLEGGSLRFNELQRQMPAMTHATLSVQLKSLVESGLVERTQYETIPPKVEYSLTEVGKKFRPVLDALGTWATDYIQHMKGTAGDNGKESGPETVKKLCPNSTITDYFYTSMTSKGDVDAWLKGIKG